MKKMTKEFCNKIESPEDFSTGLFVSALFHFCFKSNNRFLSLFFYKKSNHKKAFQRTAPPAETGTAHPLPIPLLGYKARGQSRWFVAD